MAVSIIISDRLPALWTTWRRSVYVRVMLIAVDFKPLSKYILVSLTIVSTLLD